MCPKCGSMQSRCLDSRQVGRTRYRRHECLSCDHRYNTKETWIKDSEGEIRKEVQQK